jgi:hypothetical protein
MNICGIEAIRIDTQNVGAWAYTDEGKFAGVGRDRVLDDVSAFVAQMKRSVRNALAGHFGKEHTLQVGCVQICRQQNH